MSLVPYASAVDCLMYSIVFTRPSLVYSVGQVNKFISKPDKQHWEAIKWIFRYLKGTTDYDLVFGNEKGDSLVVGYVDSDYASDFDDKNQEVYYRLYFYS